ncbi:tRNA ligase subunit PheS family protein [Bacteroides eggerthii]|uniref:tRNA ligase subunit PheS family protein n=1 Tax=Bacteroides eggerthii TaxID=28111 RepID=UPI00374C9AD2
MQILITHTTHGSSRLLIGHNVNDVRTFLRKKLYRSNQPDDQTCRIMFHIKYSL